MTSFILVINDRTMLTDFKRSMMKEFNMTDLGLRHYFLGIEVVQSFTGIFISQRKYALEILDRFMMKECNYVTTPTEVGLKLSKVGAGKKGGYDFVQANSWKSHVFNFFKARHHACCQFNKQVHGESN